MDVIPNIEGFIHNYGYIAVFILMLMNGSLSFPPSELVIIVGGFIFLSTLKSTIFLFLALIGGNLCGALILYWISRRWGYSCLTCIKQILPSFIVNKLPSDKLIKSLEDRFNSNAWVWVGAFRCFPVVRSIVSVPAGVSKVNVIKFIVFSSVGIFVWVSSWLLIAYFLKESWVNFGGYLTIFLGVCFIVIIVNMHHRAMVTLSRKS